MNAVAQVWPATRCCKSLLDKLSHFHALKMHNSENIISFFQHFRHYLGVFRSLHHIQVLTSATLLGQAVQKLPPDMKEARVMHTVGNKWSHPFLLEFNDCSKERAEAHDRLNVTSAKPKSYEFSPATAKLKTALKVFAATSKSDAH